MRDDLLIILEEEPWGCASRHETGSTEAIANLLQYDLGLEVLSVGSVDGRNFNGGFDTSFLCPNSKVLQRRDLPLKLESRSRRPVPLQRLKVTKGSLHHWLQKGGASTSRSD